MAHERIKQYIHKTPLLSSATVTKRTGCAAFYLKC
jgi:threonine dehydratase